MQGWKKVVQRSLASRGLEVRRVSKEIRFPEFVRQQLQEIEASLRPDAKRDEVFSRLRALSLTDFGLLLLSLPHPSFPRLSAILPQMAKEETQVKWTGASGVHLLTQTLDFVRSLSYNFTRYTGRPLQHADILDYGCGYGRITRLMYYFSNEDQVFGIDPWEKSIEICHADGLTKNFLLSDRLPTILPSPKASFDLIFAFSVFTHLSEKATLICLNTIAEYLSPDGMLAITIRPSEYWDEDPNASELNLSQRQKLMHQDCGFAFLPHQDGATVDGEITYGDTSLRLDWLADRFPQLRIEGIDRSLSDPYQIYVYLRKRRSC